MPITAGRHVLLASVAAFGVAAPPPGAAAAGGGDAAPSCPNLNASRPTGPYCPEGWWTKDQKVCFQGCPLATTKRDPASGRCKCASAASCGQATPQCIAGECVQCALHPPKHQQEPTIGPIDPDYKYASAAAVERWHDQKFGLRIHWGLCEPA